MFSRRECENVQETVSGARSDELRTVGILSGAQPDATKTDMKNRKQRFGLLLPEASGEASRSRGVRKTGGNGNLAWVYRVRLVVTEPVLTPETVRVISVPGSA